MRKRYLCRAERRQVPTDHLQSQTRALPGPAHRCDCILSYPSESPNHSTSLGLRLHDCAAPAPSSSGLLVNMSQIKNTARREAFDSNN